MAEVIEIIEAPKAVIEIIEAPKEVIEVIEGVGPQGAIGPVGPAGAVGPVGPAGAVGPAGPAGGTTDWNALINKPSTFSPSSHTHPASAISDSTGSGRTLLTSNLVGARAHLSLFPSFANRAAFPETGDVDRVYTALDTFKIYVWVSSSSTYVEVSPQVKADWNATSGDAEILNKPSSLPPSAHNHDDLYFNAAVPWTANHTLVDGTRYLAGDVVHSGGRIYRAKFDNESIPVTDAVYWQDLGPGNRLNIDGRDIANIPTPQTVKTARVETQRIIVGDGESPNYIDISDDGIAFNNAFNVDTKKNTRDNLLVPTYDLVGAAIEFVIACSNETSPLTAGTKVTFRAPVSFRLTSVAASVTVAPTGSALVVDINQPGLSGGLSDFSVLSTKLHISPNQRSSASSSPAAVIRTEASSISDFYNVFPANREITIDIDHPGALVAGAGLKVILRGTRL
jgi:hypothetical protein